MFKCKECGCEFNLKPDYCDCGNNTFDEIQTSTINKKSDTKKIISVIIFIFCLILSIIPWTIKDKIQTAKPIVQKAQPVSNEIPDIDKIWDSTSIKIEKTIPITKPISAKEIIIPKPIQINPEPKPKKNQQSQKSTKPQSNTQKSTKPETIQKPKPIIQTQRQPQTQPQPVVKTEVQLQTEITKNKPQIDKTPLINYKNELRVALLSKLNVPSIQGIGDCAVSFSIDNNGKLLNRKFIYKSSNKTVNDEVYYMLMRLPYFKIPPEIYNGEIIKIKFYINNGYYEISFI